MLNREIRLFFLIGSLFLFQCEEAEDVSAKIISTSRNQISNVVYDEIYKDVGDSIQHWVLNSLSSCTGERLWKYYLDSTICFNSKKDRFITCIHVCCTDAKCTSDEIKVLLGEKLNDSWFFFKENVTITASRSTIKEQDIHKCLSYEQMHKIAIKEVYGGYLQQNGVINEGWFISHFENVGWGDFTKQDAEHDWYLKGRRFKTEKEFFESAHLDKVKLNWASRDTTKPIIPLSPPQP